MKIEYRDSMNPQMEVIVLLEQFYAVPDRKDGVALAEMKRICDTYTIPEQALAADVEPLAQLQQSVLEQLPGSPEDLRFLFTPCGTGACLAWPLVFQGDVLRRKDYDYSALTEQERLMEVAEIASSVTRADALPPQAITSLPELVAFLERLDAAEQEKWRYLALYFHLPEYAEKARHIVQEGAKLYMAALPEAVQAQYEACAAQSQTCFDASVVLDQLQQNEETYQVVVLPCAMSYYAVRYIVNKDYTVALAGTLYWRIAELVERYASNGEVLLGRIKCLGDKSRLEIMTMLKEQPCCGQDLAAKLSLTQGTVSHHLNLLSREGFVQISRSGNRILCRTDRHAVESFLLNLRKTLL